MYEVLKFVWKRATPGGDDDKSNDNEYVVKMRQLAQESEERISDENAPLFLKFVNLLINDAIYLLDEVLRAPFLCPTDPLRLPRKRGQFEKNGGLCSFTSKSFCSKCG